MGKARPWNAVFSNVDLLTLLLLRLPPKELVKFKCVCKLWYTLISDSDFCHNYILRHHNRLPSALLFSGDYLPSPHFETVPLTPHLSPFTVPSFDYMNVSHAMILRSCNGLLLCSARFPSSPDESRKFIDTNCSIERYRAPSVYVYGYKYFTCNPTTKQFITIPIPNWKLRRGIGGIDGSAMLSLYLAFDPLKSPNFKIVSLRESRENFPNLRVDIYSSLTGFWSETDVSFTPPYGMGIASGVFCKGAIHWFSNDDHSVCFDVDSHCLKPIPMLPKRRYCRDIGYFGQCRDHLHMVVLDYTPNRGFDILEMEDDYSGWSPRYHVDYSFMRSWFPELVKDDLYSILCVVEGDEEEDSVVVLLVGGLVISYNIRNHTLEELQDVEPRGIKATSNCINERYTLLDTNQSGVFQYTESLAPCL